MPILKESLPECEALMKPKTLNKHPLSLPAIRKFLLIDQSIKNMLRRHGVHNA